MNGPTGAASASSALHAVPPHNGSGHGCRSTLTHPPDAGHDLPGGKPRGIGLLAAPQQFGAHVHDPLGSAIHPAEGPRRFLASHRVSYRPPVPGVCAVRARKAVIGVESGPESRPARVCLPRHDLHGIEANMGSASRASGWEIGYFPRSAVATSCRIRVRPRAASHASMSVALSARSPVQDAQRPHHQGRRGRRCSRVPEGSGHPRHEIVLLRLHAGNAEGPPASKSTRQESPIGR